MQKECKDKTELNQILLTVLINLGEFSVQWQHIFFRLITDLEGKLSAIKSRLALEIEELSEGRVVDFEVSVTSFFYFQFHSRALTSLCLNLSFYVHV